MSQFSGKCDLADDIYMDNHTCDQFIEDCGGKIYRYKKHAKSFNDTEEIDVSTEEKLAPYYPYLTAISTGEKIPGGYRRVITIGDRSFVDDEESEWNERYLKELAKAKKKNDKELIAEYEESIKRNKSMHDYYRKALADEIADIPVRKAEADKALREFAAANPKLPTVGDTVFYTMVSSRRIYDCYISDDYPEEKEFAKRNYGIEYKLLIPCVGKIIKADMIDYRGRRRIPSYVVRSDSMAFVTDRMKALAKMTNDKGKRESILSLPITRYFFIPFDSFQKLCFLNEKDMRYYVALKKGLYDGTDF